MAQLESLCLQTTEAGAHLSVSPEESEEKGQEAREAV